MDRYHRALFQRFRSYDEASAAIGRKIKYQNKGHTCSGFNDLGCLYWTKDGTKQDYYGEGLDALL